MTEAIAIVGMACEYPDARSPEQLWENVIAQRQAFRPLPPERLRLEDYPAADERLGLGSFRGQAAVLEGYTFDRQRFRISGSAYRTVDVSHWLALDCADRALRDAGFADGAGLPSESTGVLMGNTLTGDYSRAASLQLRWPYVLASVTQGLWYARSPEVVHSTVMEALVWLRVPGDLVFAAGAVFLAVYALKLLRKPRTTRPQVAGAAQPT